MDAPAIVDTKDSVPKGLEEYYSEKDGKFRLNVTPTGTVELIDSGPLTRALGVERSARETAEKTVKSYGDITAERVRELATKDLEISNWSADRKTQEMIDSKVQTALQPKNEEIVKLQQNLAQGKTQLQSVLIDAALLTSLNSPDKAKGKPSLLVPALKPNIRMNQAEDGTYKAIVVDQNGNTRYNTESQPMTIDQFVDEKRNDPAYNGAFEGTGQSGTGATGSDRNKQPGNNGVVKTVSRSDAAGMKANFEGIANGTVVVTEN